MDLLNTGPESARSRLGYGMAALHSLPDLGVARQLMHSGGVLHLDVVEEATIKLLNHHTNLALKKRHKQQHCICTINPIFPP